MKSWAAPQSASPFSIPSAFPGPCGLCAVISSGCVVPQGTWEWTTPCGIPACFLVTLQGGLGSPEGRAWEALLCLPPTPAGLFWGEEEPLSECLIDYRAALPPPTMPGTDLQLGLVFPSLCPWHPLPLLPLQVGATCPGSRREQLAQRGRGRWKHQEEDSVPPLPPAGSSGSLTSHVALATCPPLQEAGTLCEGHWGL